MCPLQAQMTSVVLRDPDRCLASRCDWWCGITDRAVEGTWRNVNDNTEPDLAGMAWGNNEPNGRNYENCLETRLKTFTNGTTKYVYLNDSPCEKQTKRFFCNFDLIPIFHLRGLSACQVDPLLSLVFP